MPEATAKKFNYTPLIVALSIVIPGLVALLYLGPKLTIEGFDPGILPPINAGINSLTTLVLIAGLVAIKNKNVELHRRLMFTALILSTLFLVFYVLYHSLSDSTPFGGEGAIRYVYFTILLSHILLAIAIVPLVLITVVRALSEKFDKHRKIAKITFPLWLYVSITGVIVYFMIAPYYP